MGRLVYQLATDGIFAHGVKPVDGRSAEEEGINHSFSLMNTRAIPFQSVLVLVLVLNLLLSGAERTSTRASMRNERSLPPNNQKML
jgi:hypothetical protein